MCVWCNIHGCSLSQLSSTAGVEKNPAKVCIILTAWPLHFYTFKHLGVYVLLAYSTQHMFMFLIDYNVDKKK